MADVKSRQRWGKLSWRSPYQLYVPVAAKYAYTAQPNISPTSSTGWRAIMVAP